MALSLVLLLLAGFLPIGLALEHALESRFPRWDPARGAPNGIIILGGAIAPRLSRAYQTAQLTDSGERITTIAKLARAYPDARIVYSGGDGSLSATAGRETDQLGPLLDSFGVPRERVVLEGRSRNTVENAVFTKEMVHPKPGERWLLVTSAWHMPRAVGCFRRIGFPVEAYPVDWHTMPEPGFFLSRTFSGGLAAFDRAAHEWIGLLAYWLTGKTTDLFPAPETPR
jgi:uncharacterized SAM-binding protein YcdF (DUF218 family)